MSSQVTPSLILDNPNDKEYLEELKKGLIDMYACLTFAVNGGTDTPKSEEIFNHFTFLATFIVRTCDRSENPTIVKLYHNLRNI